MNVSRRHDEGQDIVRSRGNALVCIDPLEDDPEAWNCDCLQNLQAACGGENPTCYHEKFCAACGVCLSWKQTHCTSDEVQTHEQNCPAQAVPTATCDETVTGSGEAYRGCQDKTSSGRTCQKWTAQSPQAHSISDNSHPNKGIGDHNFCRNPDGEPNIWCYTTDSNKR